MRRLLLALAFAMPAQAATLYDQGKGIAFLGAGNVAVSAEGFPCVNCHMPDGMGSREGNLRPAEITWPALQAKGYDDASLARALAEGMTPDGRRLDPVMPRYRIEAADFAALAAHLKELGAAVPGVTGDEIRIATLLPANQAGREVSIVLGAAIAEINRSIRPGGRRLTLNIVTYENDAEAAVQRALAGDPFCFLANLLPKDAADLIGRSGVPDIAPLAPPVIPIVQRLLDIAPEAVLVHEGAVAQKFPTVAHTGPPRELAARLRGRKAVLLVAGPDYARAFMDAAEALGWRPQVLGLREQLAPLAAGTSMILAAPEPPPRRTQAFRNQIGGMGGSHESLQRTAFAGASLLAETLRRIGRSLTREALAATATEDAAPHVTLWTWNDRAGRLVPLEPGL